MRGVGRGRNDHDLAAQKVHLRADPARLQQIFWNLINNAVKFTPENGQIHISTGNDSDEQLHVEIADTGLGIEPESLPKIFDAFEQGTRTRSGGLGLGLAISKTLVEAHQGSITAESAGPNKGTKFSLTFPTCPKPDRDTVPTVRRQASQRQSMRILLVEDHEDTNRSLTNLLRRRGYYVQSAASLRSALDLNHHVELFIFFGERGFPEYHRESGDCRQDSREVAARDL